jgi:hypothetical protein
MMRFWKFSVRKKKRPRSKRAIEALHKTESQKAEPSKIEALLGTYIDEVADGDTAQAAKMIIAGHAQKDVMQTLGIDRSTYQEAAELVPLAKQSLKADRDAARAGDTNQIVNRLRDLRQQLKDAKKPNREEYKKLMTKVRSINNVFDRIQNGPKIDAELNGIIVELGSDKNVTVAASMLAAKVPPSQITDFLEFDHDPKDAGNS